MKIKRTFKPLSLFIFFSYLFGVSNIYSDEVQIDVRSELEQHSTLKNIYLGIKSILNIPYVYKVKNDKQYFVFVGTNHTNDMNSKTFSVLEKEWELFLEQVHDFQKLMVLIEGGEILGPFENKSEAVERFVEMGYSMYLAQTSGIPSSSPELSNHDRVTLLLKKFSREEVQLADFLKIVPQWVLFKKQHPQFKAYVEPFLERDAQEKGWQDFDFTYEHMLTIHKKILGRDFSENSWKSTKWFCNPVFMVNRANEVSKQSGIERDAYIASQIVKHWRDGYSLFVVWGGLHAINLESSLLKRIN